MQGLLLRPTLAVLDTARLEVPLEAPVGLDRQVTCTTRVPLDVEREAAALRADQATARLGGGCGRARCVWSAKNASAIDAR